MAAPASPDGRVDFRPDPELFPFESRWFDSSVGSVHYLDEGSGRPLLLLHGNPDWSFLYRKIVLGLRGSFRCIAPDYPGFGLSAHPPGYGYTPAEHASVVGELVDHLGLEDLVVMGQDWGGPVGLEVASRRADRVTGLVMGNTWFWPADTLMFTSFSRLMSSPPIQMLIRRRNFFVDPLMKRFVQAPLTEAELDHYRDVVPTPESREGIAVFPREIRRSAPWLRELEARVISNLRDKPIVLIWGMKDPAFGREDVIARWERTFSSTTLSRLDRAGHYIQEDAPEQIVSAILREFGPGSP